MFEIRSDSTGQGPVKLTAERQCAIQIAASYQLWWTTYLVTIDGCVDICGTVDSLTISCGSRVRELIS